ncbi:MAG: D-glycero-beta-D-manno-heptose 1,7-bisphosphate 7-phosphatase [Betaproteobacteria bacterium]
MKPLRRAVFMDRDGVLNHDRGYVSRPEDFEWLPGVMHALRALQRAGWRLVVVTNQSGIARGLYGPAEYDNLTGWMQADLARHGIALDGVYHCPHLPDAPLAAWRRQCDCRKPLPGMLRRAARDLDLDLPASVMVGDKPSDLLAGRAAGVAACIRIAEAIDHASCDIADPPADFTCESLAQAARWLLQHEDRLHA